MRPRPLAALLAAGLLLAACGGDDGAVATATPERSTSTGATPSTGGGGPEVIDQLDFVAPDVRGGEVVGAELAGRDLVVWFWAPW